MSCPQQTDASGMREVRYELEIGEYEILTFGPSCSCKTYITPIRVEHPGIVIITTGKDRTVDIRRIS